MADFVIKRGDTRRAIEATLFNPDGTKVNLTGATVKFVMRSRGADKTVKVNSDAIVADAPNGVVWYVWANADVDTIGTYDAEFRVTFADGKSDTWPNTSFLEIQVNETL